MIPVCLPRGGSVLLHHFVPKRRRLELQAWECGWTQGKGTAGPLPSQRETPSYWKYKGEILPERARSCRCEIVHKKKGRRRMSASVSLSLGHHYVSQCEYMGRMES